MKSLTDVLKYVTNIEYSNICIIGAVSIVSFASFRYFYCKKICIRKKWNSIDRDVVVLHQFPRGKFCPNLSPFALKLESYFRLSGIDYIIDIDQPFGPKGKCPWITLNGEEFSDSEVIISVLSEYFKVSLDDHLQLENKATLEAVRILVEDHLFWCVITWRYWLDKCHSFMKTQKFSPFMTVFFPVFMHFGIKSKSLNQGMGKHSSHQIYNFCEKDCSTLATILGTKRFFGGDLPCTADCSIFGGLSQLMWNAPDSIYEAIITDLHPSLEEYCLRMKEKVFQDWDQILVK